ALVSDAGLPCISDPGADIVEKAIAQNFSVVPVPGPNAAISALIASGLSPQPFLFYGFLNRGKKERRQQLEQLKKRQETILLYEAPHRLKDTLKDMEAILGERRIVLARELTKKFEEFLRGTLSEAVEWSQTEEIRGEFCIVLEGNSCVEEEDHEEAYWQNMSIVEHVDFIINQSNVSSKEAIKEVAKLRQVSKRDVYNEYHSD
ncbi:16S rRNA (cytidine(1402)-2'-O)-methyltransferase, partial [Lysinibacillus capsici]|uniref:16S rRNA (cytidine(1402)-2'-O)-methyltransferase n=1 Tax=Lysinibacillus capsici TaxID=2115968 RepID=UPI001C0FB90B